MNDDFCSQLTVLIRTWAKEKYKRDMSNIPFTTIGSESVNEFVRVVEDWSYFLFATEDRKAMVSEIIQEKMDESNEAVDDTRKEFNKIIAKNLRRDENGKVIYLNQLEKPTND